MEKIRHEMQPFTDEERLQRIIDREEIEQIIGKRVFYKANEERAEELEKLWVQLPENRRTASFGSTWGFYTGMESIRAWYVAEHDKRLKNILREYHEADPSVAEETKNLGIGRFSVSPLIAPAIQIAGDGKTAKGLWYSIGCVVQGHPGRETETRWLSTKVAVDFVREESADAPGQEPKTEIGRAHV